MTLKISYSTQCELLFIPNALRRTDVSKAHELTFVSWRSMSASAKSAIVDPDSKIRSHEVGKAQPGGVAAHKNYKGFVAGVFSGIAKLSGL